MRKLQTEVEVQKNQIFSHKSHFLLLGSCFSENIAKRLSYYRLQNISNPFGILFNPISIADSLQMIMEGRVFRENDLFLYNGLYHSDFHHGSFSSASLAESLRKINTSISEAHEALKVADCLILTFGSARVYERQGRVVANCHKLPQREFTERRITVGEIIHRYSALVRELKAFNPHLRLIFSVSPIRYLGRGAEENSLSKATLLLAIEELRQEFEDIIYFPAYEIVLDELRDYRFFADDMVHPSELTKMIVWERFSEAFLLQETLDFLPTIERLNRMLGHNELHSDSAEMDSFRKKRDELQSLVDNYMNKNSLTK